MQTSKRRKRSPSRHVPDLVPQEPAARSRNVAEVERKAAFAEGRPKVSEPKREAQKAGKCGPTGHRACKQARRRPRPPLPKRHKLKRS